MARQADVGRIDDHFVTPQYPTQRPRAAQIGIGAELANHRFVALPRLGSEMIEVKQTETSIFARSTPEARSDVQQGSKPLHAGGAYDSLGDKATIYRTRRASNLRAAPFRSHCVWGHTRVSLSLVFLQHRRRACVTGPFDDYGGPMASFERLHCDDSSYIEFSDINRNLLHRADRAGLLMRPIPLDTRPLTVMIRGCGW